MPKRDLSKEDITRIVEEENVRFLRLMFTDIMGTIKMLKYQLAKWKKS